MFKAAALVLALNLFTPGSSSLLSCVNKIVLPVYPKLCRMAHDARIVSAKIRAKSDGFEVIKIEGGNRYYDDAIRSAVSEWVYSGQSNIPCEFVVKFDFRLSEHVDESGKYEIEFNNSTIVIWGQLRFTPTTS